VLRSLPLSMPAFRDYAIIICLAGVTLLAPGCTSSQKQAGEAYQRYQAAAAANDLPEARKALLEAVAADESSPQFWSELGEVQLALRSWGDAYYAFQRAHELDRRDPELLRALTELSLRTGDLKQAKAHAEALAIIAPGDRWPKLVSGFAAFGEGRPDDALKASNTVLVDSPFDPLAILLKSRALIAQGQQDDAVALLKAQLAGQPSDVESARLLGRIYERRGDWANTKVMAGHLSRLLPDDDESELLFIEAAFRSGQAGEGRQESVRLIKRKPKADVVAQVVRLWAGYWTSRQRIATARQLALQSSAQSLKTIYAGFLNEAGDEVGAASLVEPVATLPVTAANADENAVFADSLARGGKPGPAKARFDAVLAFDPGVAMALRGRAQLMLRAHRPGAAIVDAQKLVTVLPDSAEDWLLLARCYLASGNEPQANRTLWTAFRSIQGNDKIFAALTQAERSNPERVREMQSEFNRQRDAKLSRGLL